LGLVSQGSSNSLAYQRDAGSCGSTHTYLHGSLHISRTRHCVCCVWIWFLLWFWFSFWSWFWFCSWSHHITYSAVNASISGYAVSSKGPWVVPMGSTECRQTNKLVVHILHRTSGLVTRAKIFHSTCLTQLEPVARGERSFHPIERFSMQIQLLRKMSIKNRN